MTQLSFWNCLSLGSFILSTLTFLLLLLSEHSYWLMRLFFATAVPVAASITLIAFIVIITIVLTATLKLRWQMKTTWTILLWISIFALSGFSFLGAFFTKYEITANASFNHQKYYLIKFLYVDTYSYKLYHCESLSLFCSRSSSYIGIPYQNDPISLHYNSRTQKVYIQNASQIIPIPD